MSSQDFRADVIVVGAGSAGCAVTRRLVDRGDLNVLLLEAGGLDRNPAIHDPARMHELWLAPEDWAYYTVPQSHADDRQLHWPRGRVLGGSSSLNGMIWVRGAREDYSDWVALGANGWSWDEVLPVFVRMEDHDGGPSELRGVGGPTSVIGSYPLAPIHQAIIAAAEELGIERNGDYNTGHLDGVSQQQLTIRAGRRHSAADAYLKPVLHSENLRVVTGAHVRRLLIESGRCVGVEWSREGRLERARAGVEVVLSAGTIVSPKLLMVSGLGPADELARHGIDIVVDLPGVGSNLHDHLLTPAIFAAELAIDPPAPGLSQIQSHLWWRSRSGLPGPDTQPIHFSVPLYEPWMQGPSNGFTLAGGLVRPASRGRVTLSGPDPEDPLLLDPMVLTEPEDLDSLAASLQQVRAMGAGAQLGEWGAVELYPGPSLRTEAEVRDYVRRTAITYHHQVGTCRIGVDPGAVVDPELRVHGIEGLRVADASVMPRVTSGNTNAPSIMIGERASDFIARAHTITQTESRTG